MLGVEPLLQFAKGAHLLAQHLLGPLKQVDAGGVVPNRRAGRVAIATGQGGHFVHSRTSFTHAP